MLPCLILSIPFIFILLNTYLEKSQCRVSPNIPLLDHVPGTDEEEQIFIHICVTFLLRFPTSPPTLPGVCSRHLLSFLHQYNFKPYAERRNLHLPFYLSHLNLWSISFLKLSPLLHSRKKKIVSSSYLCNVDISSGFNFSPFSHLKLFSLLHPYTLQMVTSMNNLYTDGP